MRYVIAGYTIILSLLFLYALQLVWRRQRLTRAVERLEAAPASSHVPVPAHSDPRTESR